MLPKNKYKNTVHSCSYCESRSYLSFHPFDDHDDENDDSLVSRNSFFFFSLSPLKIFSVQSFQGSQRKVKINLKLLRTRTKTTASIYATSTRYYIVC